MTVPITLTNYTCQRCGLGFTSGAGAPQCLQCNSSQVTSTGTAASLSVPSPVPAGVVLEEEAVADQVRAAAAVSRTLLTYRCLVCGWVAEWPAIGEPPASIGAHEETHKGQVQA